MKTRTILIENWMIAITREQSKICMMLVGKIIFNYAGVAMLSHGYGVSQYPQFYD